jgi:hypothetical protein
MVGKTRKVHEKSASEAQTEGYHCVEYEQYNWEQKKRHATRVVVYFMTLDIEGGVASCWYNKSSLATTAKMCVLSLFSFFFLNFILNPPPC